MLCASGFPEEAAGLIDRGGKEMKTVTFNRDQVIFNQNDIAKTMYDINEGRVGIYVDYKTDNEKLIQELDKDALFGEMGLIECYPRSATAVALEDNTVLTELDEDDFFDYFGRNKQKTLQFLRLLSARIRETNDKYLDVCRVVYQSHEAEKSNVKRDDKVNKELDMICKEYGNFNTMWLD